MTTVGDVLLGMMASICARLALAALWSLALAASASAECAWVLWEEAFSVSSDRGVSPKEWAIVGTALDAKECGPFANRARDDRAQRLGSADLTTEKSGNQVTVKGKSIMINYRYLCLPDTVDPRGPKGTK